MNVVRFDAVSEFFSLRRLSRRRALTEGSAVAAAASLAATSPAVAAAQDATPEGDGDDSQVPEMLFVQSFQSGSIVPNDGTPDRFTLTLEHGLGQTIYFSDRPERLVGTNPTAEFVKSFPFPPDNPPNAALVVETAPGETDIAVVKLFDLVYDPAGPTVTYEMEVLENWEDSLSMGFAEAPTDLVALAPSFGAAHLFIDDCPDSPVYCIADAVQIGFFGGGGMCWNYGLCIPCEPYGHNQPDRCATVNHWKERCNNSFAACQSKCYVGWDWPFDGLLCPDFSET